MTTVPVETDAPRLVGRSAAGARQEAAASQRALAVFGAVNVIVMVAYAIASYGLARLIPVGTAEPIEARALDRLVDAVAPLGSWAHTFFRGETAIAAPTNLFITYALFLLIPTLTFVALLRWISQNRESLDEAAVRRLFRWAVGFAVVLAFAHPVLVQDFWLSAGWGRLIANGVNPYYVNLDPVGTEGLPLDYLELLMTYGPLWALLSGGVMKVAGSSPVIAGLLFKAILASAWIASLALVGRLLRSRPVADRCVGMAIAGWLPLGAFMIVAEGHNDVAMALPVLLWLVLLERGRHLPATASLAASVLVKYLSAPLFLLDLLHAVRSRGRPWIAYAPHAALAALLGITVFGVFFRSPAFFESTAHMAGWHFFTPRDAVTATGRLLGIEPSLASFGGILVAGLGVGVQLFFALLIPLGIARYWREPSVGSFRYAVLMTSAGILLGVAGHLWPWFMAWALLLGSLQPAATITRFITGLALAIPFALLHWTVFPSADVLSLVTPPLYVFVLVWFMLVPRSWFGARGTAA